MTFTQKHRHIFVSLSTQKILIMLINLKVFLRSCRIETKNLCGLVKNRFNECLSYRNRSKQKTVTFDVWKQLAFHLKTKQPNIRSSDFVRNFYHWTTSSQNESRQFFATGEMHNQLNTGILRMRKLLTRGIPSPLSIISLKQFKKRSSIPAKEGSNFIKELSTTNFTTNTGFRTYFRSSNSSPKSFPLLNRNQQCQTVS